MSKRIIIRNTTISFILISMFAMAFVFVFNKKANPVKAESQKSIESIIYTDQNAFDFTPISETECSVKLVDKTIENIRLPQKVMINDMEYAVKEIQTNGFASASSLKTIIMPSIRRISSAAFQNCKNLELAYAPKVEEISMGAFIRCPLLSDIIFPSTLKTVGSNIFLGNKTTVHARFDTASVGWSSSWNSGNGVQDHDYNTIDENGNLWLHDFIYEEVQQINPYTKTVSTVKKLAPFQPFMENESQGHLEIGSECDDIGMFAFSESTFETITILSSDKPINISSMAFSSLTIKEGFTINRDVTYNCELSGESIMPFNSISTPFITLPTPETIVIGMFFANKINNINFRPVNGTIAYENIGVVKIPESISVIKDDAFNNVSGITDLYLPRSINVIGNNVFEGWDDTQTIHTALLSEVAATRIYGKEWKNRCDAKVEYAGEMNVVSQPEEITDEDYHSFIIDFKYNNYYYSSSEFNYNRPYTYWNKVVFSSELDYNVIENETSQDGYTTHRWEYKFKVKPTSSGGCAFTQTIQVKIGDDVHAEISTKKITIHKFIRKVSDMTFLNNQYQGDYKTYLLCDLNLDTINKYTKCGVNYGNFYGDNHTITYNFNIDKVPAKTMYIFGVFSENRGFISNLNVKATIKVANYGSIMENGTAQNGSVRIGGIAYENVEAGIIQNCNVQLNIDINAGTPRIGGISVTNYGVINNCTSKGSIVSSGAPDGANAGGIVSINSSTGTITKCINEASITGSGNTGGISSGNSGQIDGCQNKGTLTYRYNYFGSGVQSNRAFGGITGTNSGKCTNCKNSGTIKYGGCLSYDGFIQPIMGQIAGTQTKKGLFSGNTWTGKVDTTGLSPEYGGGFDQTLYAKNEEYGKSE